jgi:pimeloyl-ACP methyl ester carboxylesterase
MTEQPFTISIPDEIIDDLHRRLLQTRCGVLALAKEEPMPPRSWVERGYNVVRWTEKVRGGHFAAWEEPELFSEEVRAAFKSLR